MLKKALSGSLETFRRSSSGLPAATRAGDDETGPEAEEWGRWHYIVTDPSGIRPRLEACYSRESKRSDRRFQAGSIVEIDKRRRAGWTRWLNLANGEGWLFDVSPKDRKVRMVEAEVQKGEWQYEVCSDQLCVFQKPVIGAESSTKPASVLHIGDRVTAVERVRPLVGRGVFVRVAEVDGWMLDFVDGIQTLRRPPRAGTGSDPSPTAFSPKKEPEDVLGEPEPGQWRYIVLDPKGLTLRGRPTYDRSAKLKTRVEEGEVVEVVERRAGAGTTFLRIDGPGGLSGWGFDIQPGPHPCMRMMEPFLDEGIWFYRILCDRGCFVRSRCSLADSAKVRPGPEKGALVQIGLRVKVGSTTFLRLKDESGWFFDQKDGRTLVEGPLSVQQMRNAVATVVVIDGVQLLKAPTNESWARTKMVLLNESKVQVSLKANLDDRCWLEVSKIGGGMQGWVLIDVLEFDAA